MRYASTPASASRRPSRSLPVRLAALPAVLPAHVRPGGACPPVGPWDIGAPPARPGAPSSQPAVHGSAQTATSPSRGRAGLPRLPRGLGARLGLCGPCLGTARGRGGRLLATPGVCTASVGPPTPAMPPGAPGLSHVPASPLGPHAPLAAPGGVLDTRLGASRTAAGRPRHAVGVSLAPTCGGSCGPRLSRVRGSITRPPSSFLPASYAHDWGGTWRALLTCGRGVGQVGGAPLGAHPLGHSKQCPRMAPHPMVSGLSWHEQCLVRRRSW